MRGKGDGPEHEQVNAAREAAHARQQTSGHGLPMQRGPRMCDTSSYGSGRQKKSLVPTGYKTMTVAWTSVM